MDGNGWIKLHRQLKDHWLWKSEKRLKWWIDVLLTVNHSDTKVMVNGHLIECQKGQSIRSLSTWAKDWNVSKKAVRDYFKLLERDSIISLESVHFTTRITVCKYEDYQGQVNAKYTERKREVTQTRMIRIIRIIYLSFLMFLGKLFRATNEG
ncbi:MAG: hypothetical protein WCP85_12675 [Mariniphaga sp.]